MKTGFKEYKKQTYLNLFSNSLLVMLGSKEVADQSEQFCLALKLNPILA